MWSVLIIMLNEGYMAFKNDEERRVYFREYNKGWYQRHKERLIKNLKQRRRVLQEWYQNYKSSLSCVDCGENHPACLHFHHKDRKEKSFTISYVATRGAASIKTIIKEMEKCEVLCGNCHAIRHWRETHNFDDWREVLPLVD